MSDVATKLRFALGDRVKWRSADDESYVSMYEGVIVNVQPDYVTQYAVRHPEWPTELYVRDQDLTLVSDGNFDLLSRLRDQIETDQLMVRDADWQNLFDEVERVLGKR